MEDSDWFEEIISGDIKAIEDWIARDPGVVKQTGEFGFSALHYLAEEEQWETVRLLIAHGADVNARNDEGITPLHLAGWSKMADILLDSGADINARDNEGSTPLHILSAEPERDEVVARLLKRGADATLSNHQGKTPLDIARLREDDAKVILLERRV